MELRHLKYFVAVAQEMSFTHASEKLHIAQPPLSQQIRQLEDELGVVLIERGRPLKLTEAGKVFLERASCILSSIDSAVGDVRRISGGFGGRLSISFPGSAMFSILPEVLKIFRQSYPGVQLGLYELLPFESAQALRNGEIDVSFTRPPIGVSADFDERVLVREPFAVVVPSQHPLAPRGEVSLTELEGEPLILYPRYPLPSTTDIIVKACQDVGFEPLIIQEVRHLQTAIGLVSSGIGITLIASSVALQPRRGVTFLRLRESTPTHDLSMAWRRGTVPAALKHFIETVEHETPRILRKLATERAKAR